MRRVHWPQIILALSLVIASSFTAAERQATNKAPGPGDAIDTTHFAGKVLVVTFWASWCGPCKAELPVLEGLQNAAKGNVQVVAVNIEPRETFRAVSRALSSLNLTLTNDPNKWYSTAYGVNGNPHMVIIGKDGKILHVHRGYNEKQLDEFAAEINAMLAKGLGSWEARFVSRRAFDPKVGWFFASTHRPIDCLYIITVHSLIANP